MNIFTSLSNKSQVAAVLASLTIAVGCASGPPPSLKAQLAQTDTSIAQAEQAGAARGGLTELQQAKDKRANAQEALDDKKYDVAMRFAQQAQLDAQFASQKSAAGEATKSAVEVRRGNDALQDETERKEIAPVGSDVKRDRLQ